MRARHFAAGGGTSIATKALFAATTRAVVQAGSRAAG
jgi:hypothetical protein